MKRSLRQWRVWLLLALALVLLGVVMGGKLLGERDQIAERELQRMSAQTKVVEDSLTRQLTAINFSLLSIQDALPRWRLSPTGNLEGQQALRNMKASMPSVRTLLVLDDQGTVTYSSRDELKGRNFFERDYVQAPLKALDPKLLYLSPPFNSVLNNYLLNLTRVMLDDQGRFTGVVSAAIDPVELAVLLNSVRYSDDMQAILLHGDGKVLLSSPALDPAMERDLLAPDTLLGQHLRNQPAAGDATNAVALRTDQRLNVMRTIAPEVLLMDKHLEVVLTRPSEPLLTGWRQDVLMQAGAYLVLVLVSVFGLSIHQAQRTQKIVAAKRLKLATDASGVGIWEFDLLDKSYVWDDNMFALFGMPPKATSLRNDEWTRLLPAKDLLRMRDATRATIQHDQPFDMTFQIRRPDGQVRFMHNRAALYSDEHGVPRRLIGATEDVTERMAQESELRIAAAAFESHESILVTNAQAEILRVNHAFTQLFGLTAAEVMGRNPGLLKSGRHEDDFYAAMWFKLTAHHSWQGEIWNVGKDGVEFPCWLCITAVCDDAGVVTHYVATYTDITLRKAAEDEVKRLAFFDPLTNLPNRRLLSDRLHQAVAKVKREKGRLALIFVDLDRFKPVNDRHGHAAGDQLLQAVANRLRTCVRESDTVARVGGDEFVVLLTSISQAQDAMHVAQKMHAALREPFHLPDGKSVQISSSAGIAMYPDHGLDEAALWHHADVAMYAAKGFGRDQYLVYTPTLGTGEPVAPPEAMHTPTAQAASQPAP